MATLTPPKYIEALRDREKSVLLEERLEHFMEWLQERCWPIEPKESKSTFDNKSAIKALIEEYVNG